MGYTSYHLRETWRGLPRAHSGLKTHRAAKASFSGPSVRATSLDARLHVARALAQALARTRSRAASTARAGYPGL